MSPERISFQVSNLCLSPRDVVLGGIEPHVRFLYDVHETALAEGASAGYDGGYEITPVRVLQASIYGAAMQGRLRRQAAGEGPPERTNGVYYIKPSERIQPTDIPLYSSMHAGWPPLASKYAIPFVDRYRSLGSLERMGQLTGLQPTVVYSDLRRHGKPIDYRQYELGRTSVQLTPEELAGWNIATLGDYDQIPHRMAAQGIDELVAASFHTLRAQKSNPHNRLNVERLLDVIEGSGAQSNDTEAPKPLIPIGRAHLEVGRGDFPNEDDIKRSLADLHGLITGPDAFAKTKAGEFLTRCFGIWQKQSGDTPDARWPVVMEVLPSGLAVTAGYSPAFDKLNLAQKHGVLVAHARQFFASLP